MLHKILCQYYPRERERDHYKITTTTAVKNEHLRQRLMNLVRKAPPKLSRDFGLLKRDAILHTCAPTNENLPSANGGISDDRRQGQYESHCSIVFVSSELSWHETV